MNISVPYFSSPVTQQCSQWGVTNHPNFAIALQVEKEIRLLQLAKIGCVALKILAAMAIGAVIVVGILFMKNYVAPIVMSFLFYASMPVVARVAATIFIAFGVMGVSGGLLVFGGALSIAKIFNLIDNLEVNLNMELYSKHITLANHLNVLQNQ